ncbi:hypothetical protein GG804_15405 [Sphingomonas histidinilytica]|jgi:hypothetical protein|uniref:Nuclear transport factor 2 family protein n=1 Tax=Rhizorhabdus histidinilytica TaxID=439228 RepID=A0A1T5AT50_9SPHN|nr:hypothetical protein [Rhizorhabdus histidinilytica]MBO9378157.1 hypothetical protein [Rhizorhabdus histidinilytica]QEH79629.1 hypothetical protein EIK56_16390 [Sphingomonas sp. C8-2]SKB38178.1 hypothetical protein SAMN06295920_102215 [Rhizorhabdus histidinilytica]
MSDQGAVARRVAEKCRQFENRFRAGQLAVMVQEFYLPDAIMEGRELPAQIGHEAITRLFIEVREVCRSIEIEIDPITVIGPVAFGNITNRNTLMTGDVEIHRVLMIWQEKDGDWFVSRDFFFAEQGLLLSELDLVPLVERRPARNRKPRGQVASKAQAR